MLRAVRAEMPAAFRRWAASLAVARTDHQQRGFCLSRGDWQDDVHAVAVPLQGDFDGERLVLNCGVAARRLKARELESRIGPLLLQLARQIENDWRIESATAR